MKRVLVFVILSFHSVPTLAQSTSDTLMTISRIFLPGLYSGKLSEQVEFMHSKSLKRSMELTITQMKVGQMMPGEDSSFWNSLPPIDSLQGLSPRDFYTRVTPRFDSLKSSLLMNTTFLTRVLGSVLDGETAYVLYELRRTQYGDSSKSVSFLTFERDAGVWKVMVKQ